MIWEMLFQQTRGKVQDVERLLGTEERSAQIARLQGYLAGATCYEQVAFSVGIALGEPKSEIYFFDDDNNFNYSLDALVCFVRDAEELEKSEEYEKFKEEWKKIVEDKKNRLFYESEKGRDLYFVKGWYEAMNEVDRQIKKLKTALEEAEREKAESLPFD